MPKRDAISAGLEAELCDGLGIKTLRPTHQDADQESSTSDSQLLSDPEYSEASGSEHSERDDKQDASADAEVPPTQEPSLDPLFLEVLGIDPEAAETKEIKLQADIHKRWLYYLKKGLRKPDRKALLETYDGLSDFKPPSVNNIVLECLPKDVKTRDAYQNFRQQISSGALGAVAAATLTLLAEGELDKKALFKSLLDAGLLLADLLHNQSKGRAAAITYAAPKDVRRTLADSKPSTFLFGDDLVDRIKSDKACNKLLSFPKKKEPLKQTGAANNHLNYQDLQGQSSSRLQAPHLGAQQLPSKLPQQRDYRDDRRRDAKRSAYKENKGQRSRRR